MRSSVSKLIGRQILNSAKIKSSISELLNEVARCEQGIDGVRPPDPALADSSRKAFDEAGKYRGRPLFYPYLGTGSGRGPYVELEDGSVKLDLINGIGVHILGHGHAKVREASLRGALADIVMQGNLEPNHEYSILARNLIEHASKQSRLKYAWIATCGTMANENALKMARQKHTPARFVMAMKNAFAGRSTMMAEITDNPAYRQGLPEYNEVLRVPWFEAGDPGSIDKSLAVVKEHVAKHGKNISCFVFEPMLGEGGYRAAPREFFVPMLEFCRAHKIAVWADEVQTFMRTGELFAFETLGIGEYIDLCTVAKTLQCGATLYTEEYNPQPGLVAGTFAGSSPALSAGIAILDEMTSGGYFGPNGKVMKIHREFIAMLNRLNTTTCKGLLRDAGGMGLMVAVTPLDGGKETVTQLLHTLFKNGLIAFSCGRDPYRLRFLIPAVMETKDIELAGTLIEKSIRELA